MTITVDYIVLGDWLHQTFVLRADFCGPYPGPYQLTAAASSLTTPCPVEYLRMRRRRGSPDVNYGRRKAHIRTRRFWSVIVYLPRSYLIKNHNECKSGLLLAPS